MNAATSEIMFQVVNDRIRALHDEAARERAARAASPGRSLGIPRRWAVPALLRTPHPAGTDR